MVMCSSVKIRVGSNISSRDIDASFSRYCAGRIVSLSVPSSLLKSSTFRIVGKPLLWYAQIWFIDAMSQLHDLLSIKRPIVDGNVEMRVMICSHSAILVEMPSIRPINRGYTSPTIVLWLPCRHRPTVKHTQSFLIVLVFQHHKWIENIWLFSNKVRVHLHLFCMFSEILQFINWLCWYYTRKRLSIWERNVSDIWFRAFSIPYIPWTVMLQLLTYLLFITSLLSIAGLTLFNLLIRFILSS